jgi:hypothetical protein
MSKYKSPRLRTVEKVKPPFPLNQFPNDFGYNLGKEIVYLLATKNNISLKGEEFEAIFALCVGAEWKPSNNGLDDIVLDNCAWGAKTVTAKPEKEKRVRLISGRNSPVYSFGESQVANVDPNILGEQILSIWNERVSGVRRFHKHLRTVVLMKSNDLETLGVFEFDTVRYEPELYSWEWNKNNNLVGYDNSNIHRFTWQPSGSQFTVVEEVPEDCLIIKIKKPERLDKEGFLKGIGFNRSWLKVTKKNG